METWSASGLPLSAWDSSAESKEEKSKGGWLSKRVAATVDGLLIWGHGAPWLAWEG